LNEQKEEKKKRETRGKKEPMKEQQEPSR